MQLNYNKELWLACHGSHFQGYKADATQVALRGAQTAHLEMQIHTVLLKSESVVLNFPLVSCSAQALAF